MLLLSVTSSYSRCVRAEGNYHAVSRIFLHYTILYILEVKGMFSWAKYNPLTLQKPSRNKEIRRSTSLYFNNKTTSVFLRALTILGKQTHKQRNKIRGGSSPWHRWAEPTSGSHFPQVSRGTGKHTLSYSLFLL